MSRDQKRKSWRIDADLPVTLVDAQEGQSPAVIGAARNISLGGIYFESDISLNVGQRVTLQLSTFKGIVELSAVVLRKKEKGYACEFVDTELSNVKVMAAAFFPAVEP